MHAQKNIYYIKILKIMYLDAAKKQEIFGKYGKSNTDTGSTEAQIALFSYRISRLTEHMKLNRKEMCIRDRDQSIISVSLKI